MPNPIKDFLQLLFISLLLLVFTIGCAGPKKAPRKTPEPTPQTESSIEVDPPAIKEESLESPSEPKDYLHIVRWQGENLSIIAKWYTGQYSNWRDIAKANPEINPHQIFMGTRILIPEYLLKTRKPLPENFEKK